MSVADAPSPTPPHAPAREVQLATAGVVASRVVGALGGVLLARLLGPEGRGEVAAVVTVGSFAGTAGTLGLQFWIIPTVARGVLGGVRRIVQVHLVAVAATTVLTAVVLGVLPFVDARAWSAGAVFAGGWVAGMVVLAVVNGERRMGAVALATGAGSLVYVVGLLVVEATGRLTVVSAVLLAAAANAVPVPLLWSRLRALPPQLDGGAYRDAVRAGLPGAVGELLLLAMFRLDVLIVASIVPAGDVGRYAVAIALAELLLVLPDAAAQVVLPRMADGSGSGAGAATRLTVVASLLAAAALALVAPALVGAVFGERFVAAASVLRLLLPGAVAIAAWKTVAAACSAHGRSDARAWSAGVALAVLVAGDLVLVPGYGIRGAAVASTIAYGAAAAVVISLWCRSSGDSVGELLVPRAGDLGRVRALVGRP